MNRERFERKILKNLIKNGEDQSIIESNMRRLSNSNWKQEVTEACKTHLLEQENFEDINTEKALEVLREKARELIPPEVRSKTNSKLKSFLTKNKLDFHKFD